jgi:hypothetical protein
VPGSEPICEWFGESKEEKQRVKHRFFKNDATRSYNLTQSVARINVGPPGHKAEGVISIRGFDGDRIQRAIAVRVIVKKWTESTWKACHDSNWQFPPTARSIWFHVQPINCGPGFYRAKSAGIYYSRSLNQWLRGGWVETGNLCAPRPNACGLLAAPPEEATADDALNLPPPPKK